MLKSFANKQMTCRELEGELWDDYFGKNINYSKGRVLAYHWKFENECSCLIKIKYSKTNVTTLTAYIVMVLALGVVGSTIVAIIQSECVKYFPYISIGIGCFLFAIGLIFRKEKIVEFRYYKNKKGTIQIMATRIEKIFRTNTINLTNSILNEILFVK